MSGDKIQHVQIRQPATANLMVDSRDKTRGLSDNFTIQKNNSILNGFFHRIATTEVVLKWDVENVTLQNNTFIVNITGLGVRTVVIPLSFYTVERALDQIAASLTAATSAGAFSISTLNGIVSLVSTIGTFEILQTNLSNQLGLTDQVDSGFDIEHLVQAPDLRNYSYIDFLSSQLTYNQKLKDASTNAADNNVLCRWYFAWDNPPQLDGYGFPILQGYTSFVERRLFNPPKQIRWESNMPIGQLSFQIVDENGFLLSATEPNIGAYFTWQMTLQVSED